jgi:predicted dehydrogenase
MATVIKRRTFLGAAASVIVLPSSRTAFSFAANERIGLAVMGHMYVADHFFTAVHAYPGVELVALCNPDQRRVPEIWKKWEGQKQDVYAKLLANRPPVYFDFRKMLEEVKGIDALVVSMFEHHHGPACGLAMRMGNHVFCERTLGLTISE